LAAITLSIIGLNGISQDGEYIEIQDFETWGKIGINVKLNKNWSFGLEEQLRLKTNSSVVDAYFTELNAKYKMKSNFEVGGGLRYIRDNDNEGKIQGYENHLRYNLDLSYKHLIERLKLRYRMRFQSKNELGVTKNEGDYPNNHFRLKLGGEYNIKKWKFDPKVSFELFHHMEEGKDNGLDKLRTTIGTSYDLKKYGDIGLFYRIERELNPTYVDYPKMTYVFGLSYIYTIKIKSND
jgi:hypothetical protein